MLRPSRASTQRNHNHPLNHQAPIQVATRRVHLRPIDEEGSLNAGTRIPLGERRQGRQVLSSRTSGGEVVKQTDPLWAMYAKETQARDKEMLEAWSNNMDVLLVFAGLFSAILTAFLIEVHRDLKGQPVDLTNELLLAIVQRLDVIVGNGTTHVKPFQQPTFRANPRSIRINLYWFTSLAFSLLAVAGVMLAKQWFREYTHNSTKGLPYDQAHRRQERFLGLEKWGFRETLDLLPIPMHISLVLFFMGLIDFLRELLPPISALVLALFISGVTFVIVTTFLAMLSPSCPYRTPLTKYISIPLRSAYRFLRLLWSPAPLSFGEFQHSSSSHPSDTKSDLEALIWMICELRYEETVRASLMLGFAVGNSLDRRHQVLESGAITRICDFFDPLHPDYEKLEEREQDVVAFGRALHSVLSMPSLSLPTHIKEIIRLPLQYMTGHSDVHLRTLAACLGVIGGNPQCCLDYDLLNHYTMRPEEVEPWARILLLGTLGERGTLIPTCSPQAPRRCGNSPDAILHRVALIGSSIPPLQVNEELLAAVLSSMVVTLRRPLPGAPGGYPHYKTISLGLYLGMCLDEMKRYKEDGEGPPDTFDHAKVPTITLSDVERALVRLLQLVNQLLPNYPQIFGSSWSPSIAKLIDFAHDSSDPEVVDGVLKTVLLVHRDTVIMSCSPGQFKQLLYMCIIRPSLEELPAIPDLYFLEVLRLMERVLPLMESHILLEEAEKLASTFTSGLQRDNDDIDAAILHSLDYISAMSHPDSQTLVNQEDQLVKAGLLEGLLELMIRTPFGPKRSLVVKHVGWLGRSSRGFGYLNKEAVLDGLVATMRSLHGQYYAARAIILLWDSAKRGSPQAEYVDLTRRIVASDFLFTLSGWFEEGVAGENLYTSYREIQAVWLGLFEDTLEVSPSALLGSARDGISRSGILSVILAHLARVYNGSLFYRMPQTEQEAIRTLLEDLGKLVRLAKEAEKLERPA